MAYLPQTTRIRRALLAAGYKKDEFSVSTPHVARLGGYGDTHITIFAPNDRQQQLLQKVLDTKEIDVSVWKKDGKIRPYPLYREGSGKFEIVDFDQV